MNGEASTTWAPGQSGTNLLDVTAGSVTETFFGVASNSAYKLEVIFLTPATIAQKTAFGDAAGRWMDIITGDLININFGSGPGANLCGIGDPNITGVKDDLIVFVSLVAIDGPGAVLGSAGVCGRRFATDTPMPISMAQSILLQVGRALGHLHAEGVFHRDVKPSNIVIDTDGSAVVMDFGIAKRTDVTGMTVTGTTLGTPYYMSPEQCKSETLTPAADQYSLGIVAYEMLTGAVPFSGASAMETMSMNCYDEVPPLIERRADCPETMVAAVHRMLEKDPSLRFPSLEDAISDMQAKPLAADDPVQ